MSLDERCASAVDAPHKRRATDARPKRLRSAVTNGKRLFVVGDGESAWARRFRDLVSAHVADLGGADLLSEAQVSLIRRTAAIETELELMEGRLSKGEQVDLDVFTRSSSHLRRILETLGIERKQRDVTPSLDQFISDIESSKAAERANGADPSPTPSDAAKPIQEPLRTASGPSIEGGGAP